MGDRKKSDLRVPLAVVAAAVVFLVFSLSARQPRWEPLPPVEPSKPASATPGPAPAPSASASAAPVVVFAPVSAPVFAPPAYQPPTIEEVEENLKAAYAFRGITSKAILHVMAVDWMQPGYKTTINEAKMLAEKKQYDEAIRLLETALAAMDQDHITGRVALCQALDATLRRAEKWDKLDVVQKQIEELRQQTLTMVLKAAKEGGLRESEIKRVMDQLEHRRTEQAAADRAADWLSGRRLAEDDLTGGTMQGKSYNTSDLEKEEE